MAGDTPKFGEGFTARVGGTPVKPPVKTRHHVIAWLIIVLCLAGVGYAGYVLSTLF